MNVVYFASMDGVDSLIDMQDDSITTIYYIIETGKFQYVFGCLLRVI